MIQDHDEGILEKLTDIKVTFTAPEQQMGFSFEGPEIIGCTGCKIDWNKGENVTVKTIKKKQKHKGKGTIRTVTKQIPNDSFFNFFNPPEVPEEMDDMDGDTE